MERVTIPRAGRQIVRVLKPAKRGLTEKRIGQETGLEEYNVRRGLSYLEQRGYVRSQIGGRWKLISSSFRLNPEGDDDSIVPEENSKMPKKKTGKKSFAKKSTLKAKAKKAGRKVKKAAKSDVGRAGIGGGIGALALGPVGAVAGAGIAMATKKKKGRKKNPARAFSLETEIKRDRQKKTKGAAGKASRASRVGAEVSASVLRGKLAKINPGGYAEEIPEMSAAELDREHKALTALIKRADKHPETSLRMAGDLRNLRTAIVAEKRRRKRRPNPQSNPVASGMITDKTLAQYAANYRRKRKIYLDRVTSPGHSPGDIARAKKNLDDAERHLILYAEVRNMDPAELQRFMEYAASKQRAAKKSVKKRASRNSNPSVARSKIDERSIELSTEIPHLGTLAAYPRAVNMWESVYISARIRGYSKERSAKQAWGAVKNEGYYQDTKGVWRMPRRRFNPGEHPKENPLAKIPRGASESQARSIISKNIATEMEAGRPQRQAVAISLSSARRDAPKMMAKMYGSAPNPDLGDAVERERAKSKTSVKKKRSASPTLPPSTRKHRASGHHVSVVNPKSRKKTPEWKIIINRCQKLWDVYCEKPTKKNLRVVLEHLEKMKESKSKKVKDERSACLRVANKEAKRLGMK